MNREEVALLLGIVATYDRRTIGETDVVGWHAILEPWPIKDAAEAVRRYFTRSREWLMPSDLVAEIKAIRAERSEHARRELAAPPGPPTGPPNAAFIAARDQQAARSHLPLAPSVVKLVACPWCKAQQGARCTTPDGLDLTVTSAHPARYEAAGLDEQPRVDAAALARRKSPPTVQPTPPPDEAAATA